MDELNIKQKQHLAEGAALAECQTLVQEARRGFEAHHAEAIGKAHGVVCEAGQEFMHAATRHCYYQRAELQLLLRQLKFCAAELTSKLLAWVPASIWLQMHICRDLSARHVLQCCVRARRLFLLHAKLQGLQVTTALQCQADTCKQRSDASIWLVEYRNWYLLFCLASHSNSDNMTMLQGFAHAHVLR